MADSKKRPPASSSEDSTTSTPKQAAKKTKAFDPQTEAVPLGARRSRAQTQSSSNSDTSTLGPGSPGPSTPSAANNDVFKPHDKTITEMSLDDSEELFELAMAANNTEEALNLASTELQKKRAWLAHKSKVQTI